MNNIKYFEEYNLNEKITWKDIKNYGEYALIALLLGYSVLPKDIKSELIKKPNDEILDYISYYDFLIYLPIINYNNIDDINLISKNFKNKTKDFYS